MNHASPAETSPGLSYLSPKTEVRPSPIQGLGLFAIDAIERDEVVAVKGGYVLQAARWHQLEQELGAAEIQLDTDLYIAPVRADERAGSMLYSNHCCDPNIAIQGQIVFVAMRDIAAGEELTHDWATTDDDDYRMTCHCGAANCRGTVTGRDWRRAELQARYAGWFCWHLQRKIDRLERGRLEGGRDG